MTDRETYVCDTRPLQPSLPNAAWDCQVHVYGEPSRFPPCAARAYAPLKAYFEDVHAIALTLGRRYVSKMFYDDTVLGGWRPRCVAA